MKKSIKLAATIVALFGLQEGGALKVQKIDVAHNQAKLYAANIKVHGGEIQIFDQNHEGDLEFEMSQADLRLMTVAEDIRLGHKSSRSSLDDPVSDRTVSSVKPHSPVENANRDWLSQRPPNEEHLQLSDSSLRNYHGRQESGYEESAQNTYKPEEEANFEMEISPVEQSYNQDLELQQVEQENTQFNNQVDHELAEKEHKAMKQSERQRLELDNFVAEQATAVENTIQILTEDQELQRQKQEDADQSIREDKLREQKLLEYIKYEKSNNHPGRNAPAAEANMDMDASKIEVNDEYGFFTDEEKY